MNNEASRIFRVMSFIASIIAILVGVSTLAMIFLKGGAMIQRVEHVEQRVALIEQHGSPPIAEHMKLDDAREERTRERLSIMERTLGTMSELRVDTAKISVASEFTKNQVVDLKAILTKHLEETRLIFGGGPAK
jgi:hypothetical protein